MKFDVARAWKDENYRQALNEEQLNALPANPAGEISDGELADVCGGEDNDFGGGAAAASAASASSHHAHSWSLLCDINVFSIDVDVLAIPRLINIGASETQVCINAN